MESILVLIYMMDFKVSVSLGSSDSKDSACRVGDLGLIPGQEDPLEEGMATHSCILAWRILWTEEPGRLYSPWGHKELDMTERLSTQV